MCSLQLHLHSPPLWLCEQATHLVTGCGTGVGVGAGGAGWNSPGVAHCASVHVRSTAWSPGCAAGSSHLVPSLWNAQHCLISFIVSPIKESPTRTTRKPGGTHYPNTGGG